MRIIMSTQDGHLKEEAIFVRAVLRLARRLRQQGDDPELSGSAFSLMATLHREGAMSAVDLARCEGLQPQSLSRLLQRLDADGLIKREVDGDDLRRHVIKATPQGITALRRSVAKRRDWIANIMAERLTAAERVELLGAAHLMLRIAD